MRKPDYQGFRGYMLAEKQKNAPHTKRLYAAVVNTHHIRYHTFRIIGEAFNSDQISAV